MSTKNLLQEALDSAERAELPFVLFVDDLARVTRAPQSQIRSAMLRGVLGPWFLLNDEPALLRDSFIEAIRHRMAQADRRMRELMEFDLGDEEHARSDSACSFVEEENRPGPGGALGAVKGGA